MSERNELTAAEHAIMETTFKAAMNRAAAILDRITERDVMDAQLALHREGVALPLLAKVDRAMLGAAHLRACAAKGKNARVSTDDLRSAMGGAL